MPYLQVNDSCTGCLACVQNCPANALDFKDDGETRTLLHNMALCARCATCWRVCPHKAIEFRHLLENRWDEVVTLPLVRCRVCGEPVHTVRMVDTLTENLVNLADPYCPRHRARRAAVAHTRPIPEDPRPEGGMRR